MAVTTSQITITTMEGWYSGDTAPSNPLIGDLWLDTTSNEIKKYNGTTWIKQADTQGPQGPKGDSMISRVAYWIKSSIEPEPPDPETGDMKGWIKGSEPPESALDGIHPSDKFWRIYKETYSNGENEYSEYSEVELIGSYEVLNGLVQFRNGVTTTEKGATVIDGGKILTGSIEADKMSIKDLSALKAKIGGFNIGENSIYSGTKSSINNKEKGIYFDSNGHLYFGDDKSYMRFFQSADDGKYKLKISTDSLVIGSGLDVEKAFEDIKGDIQNVQGTAVEAAKTADNYISTDSTGIMVSENKGATKETPSNATKNNVLITEKNVQIRNGPEVVASYGKSAIIGKNKSNNIHIKDNGFSINHDGTEMFAVKQEDVENNYINEIMEATYEASTDTYSLESSYKTYYPNKLPVLYVIYRSKPYGIVSRKETIQYGDTKLPCTVSITEEGKYLVQFKKTDWDKSWGDMNPEIEMDYYAAGGGAMVTIGTRIDYGLANSGSWSLTVGSANTAGSRSIAVGENNVARDNSVAIGSMCYAKNDAIAVGSYAKATNYGSAAIGHHVNTDQMGQLVVGHYNRETPYGTQFVVGCGGDSETANAAAIMASGDIRLKGTVYIGCEKDSTGGKSVVDLIYPVGSIYMSVNSADPGTLFGGTWERIKDRFLLSAGDTYAAGNTGGSAKATLPSHTHTFGSGGYQMWGAKIGTGSTEPGNQISGDAKYYAAAKGKSTSNYKWLENVDSKGVSDVSQANMPPYLAVYVWKRIS